MTTTNKAGLTMIAVIVTVAFIASLLGLTVTVLDLRTQVESLRSEPPVQVTREPCPVQPAANLTVSLHATENSVINATFALSERKVPIAEQIISNSNSASENLSTPTLPPGVYEDE